LEDLYKEKCKRNLRFESEDILYIFKKSIEFILLLKEKGFVHNDIKPSNYSIILNEKRIKEIRLIDMGEFNNLE
jgi:serine/threonine protein kinase